MNFNISYVLHKATLHGMWRTRALVDRVLFTKMYMRIKRAGKVNETVKDEEKKCEEVEGLSATQQLRSTLGFPEQEST
jgi:hypothetical protein